jgi:predicted O-methyltransferase YrrM
MINKAFQFTLRVLRIAINNPKDLSHIFGIADANARMIENPESDIRAFPSVRFEDTVEGSLKFTLQVFPGVEASVSLLESAVIVSLLKRARAKNVFEFGTYKGVSTTQIALNLPEDGRVYTLDLPEDHPVYLSYADLSSPDGMNIQVPEECLHKVTFLKGDSAEFDPKSYAGIMDFVFVDGYHSYEYVKNDTEKGWEMLRPGGIIAWHDCDPTRPEMVRYLKSFDPLPNLVAGATLAFAVKPSSC